MRTVFGYGLQGALSTHEPRPAVEDRVLPQLSGDGVTASHGSSTHTQSHEEIMSERNGRQMIETLKQSRPDVAILVTREPDPNPVWDGDGPHPADDGYVCYDWTVTACTIRAGVLIEGHDYLGGSWYAPDDHTSPAALEVSGYLPQMIDEALAELDKQLQETGQ